MRPATVSLLVTSLVTTLGAAAPPPSSPRRTANGAVREISLYLKSVSFTREAVLDLAPRGVAVKGRTASGTAVLEFDLRSRLPDALDGVVRGELAGRFSAFDDHAHPAGRVRPEVLPGEENPVLRLTVEGLPVTARGLSSVDGELQTFSESRRIRFHIPWLKDEVPLRVEVYGGAATLKRFQLVGADTTLWVGVRPPDGFRLAPLDQPGSLAARAMDIDGNLVNGGGITEITRTGTDADPEYRFFAPGLRRTPSRLMLDVLCVSGSPKALPFHLRPIPFP